MILSTELLAEAIDDFIGGQAEIQFRDPLNAQEGYLFRDWVARGVGFPPLPSGWERAPMNHWATSLLGCEAQNIGPGSQGSDRLFLTLGASGEILGQGLQQALQEFTLGKRTGKPSKCRSQRPGSTSCSTTITASNTP